MISKKKKNENFICNDKNLPEVQELLKEYSHLDQSDSFVGSKFYTPKGCVITIVGVCGKKNCGRKVYMCNCSACSMDKELFPNITTTKDKIEGNSIPCGCSTCPQWSEKQNKIKIKRECDKRGYVFHGWSGEYKGNKTRLDLENPETGNRWDTSVIVNFLRGSGDPVVGYENTAKSRRFSSEEYENRLNVNSNVFDVSRSNKLDYRGHNSYLDYKCEVCSYDEYVNSGVCSGIFTILPQRLIRGNKNCRCSKNFHWTQEQREYQINKVCGEERLTFIGWSTDKHYEGSLSRFNWSCDSGHYNTSTVNDFINGGYRCRQCHIQRQREDNYFNGYFPERKNETDFLYVIDFNNTYIKVGRSFNIHERIHHGTTGLLKCSDISLEQLTILKVFTATHQEVYDTEQWIHEELTQRGFYHEESDWTIETFDIDSELLIYKLLEQSDLVETDIPSITKD